MKKSSSREAGASVVLRPRSLLAGRAGPTLSPFRPSHLWKGTYFSPLAGILIALVVFLVSLTAPAKDIEWNTLDWRFKLRGSKAVVSDLAVVFIGDDSIREYGRWPWSWDYHTLLVDVLSRHGAEAVVFDVLFAESPGPFDEGVFSRQVEMAGNVYLCSYFRGLEINTYRGFPPVGTELTEPVTLLGRRARGLGHCNSIPDEDGITRRIPLLIRHGERLYPSVALKVALDKLGVPADMVSVEPGKYIRLPLEGDEVRIPLDEEGQTLVNMTGGVEVFERFSYRDVLEADAHPDRAVVDLEKLRGKIVLVGATFAGNTDLRPTPLSKTYPMLCILGNALDNILQEDFMVHASWGSRLFFLVLLGALTGFLSYVLRPVYSLTATALLSVGMFGFSFAWFKYGQVWMDFAAPVVVVLANYLAMTTTQYVQNRREKMRYIEYLKYTNDLVESSGEAIVSFDLGGGVATWNTGAERIFGLGVREAYNSAWEDLVAAEDRPKVAEALESVLTGSASQYLEVSGQRKNGDLFPTSMNLSPVEDSRGVMVGVSCIAQDLTEKKRMVEMLIKSEKMAELGRLGSGIVHEIKNPLTSIMMLSGMVLASDDLPPKAKKYISIIDQEAQRILRLSQNILSFARPKKPEMKPIELNKVIEETLALVEYELKKNKVALSLVLQEGGIVAQGDDEKLKQVFLNLVINAVHAMEGGGALEIATGEVRSDEAPVLEGFTIVSMGELEGERAALVSIRDEGSGIPPEIIEKIFEPFFTTKGEGQGTGLGLYISQNIIREHRGRLTVASKRGTGTVFRIMLPLGARE